jgi:hypothetical protein
VSNCKISIDRKSNRVSLVSTRNIAIGEELFCSYGSQYPTKEFLNLQDHKNRIASSMKNNSLQNFSSNISQLPDPSAILSRIEPTITKLKNRLKEKDNLLKQMEEELKLLRTLIANRDDDNRDDDITYSNDSNSVLITYTTSPEV